MTKEHIFYIPLIFFTGFLLGTLVIGKRSYKKNEGLQVNSALPGSSQFTISWKFLLSTFLIFVVVFIITHLFDLPYGAKNVKSALGNLEIFDKQPSFSSSKVYERLQAFSTDGLKVYKRFTYTMDVLFPVSFFTFLFTLTCFVGKRMTFSKKTVKVLTLLPIIWFLFDLLENAIVFCLVSEFPKRNDFLGGIIGYITVTKFGFLLLSVFVPLILSIFFLKNNKTVPR